MVRKHKRRLRSPYYTKMKGETITVGSGYKIHKYKKTKEDLEAKKRIAEHWDNVSVKQRGELAEALGFKKDWGRLKFDELGKHSGGMLVNSLIKLYSGYAKERASKMNKREKKYSEFSPLAKRGFKKYSSSSSDDMVRWLNHFEKMTGKKPTIYNKDEFYSFVETNELPKRRYLNSIRRNLT